MEDTTKEALRLLGIYTTGRFDIWALAGDAKASCRAHVMSALLGRKVPRSKSGVTAIREELYSRGNITGTCGAHREDNFLKWAKGEEAEQTGEETAVISREYRKNNQCFAEYDSREG